MYLNGPCPTNSHPKAASSEQDVLSKTNVVMGSYFRNHDCYFSKPHRAILEFAASFHFGFRKNYALFYMVAAFLLNR